MTHAAAAAARHSSQSTGQILHGGHTLTSRIGSRDKCSLRATTPAGLTGETAPCCSKDCMAGRGAENVEQSRVHMWWEALIHLRDDE